LLEVIWNPDAAPVTEPVEALQALAGRLQHAANVLGARLEGADLDGPTSLAWARVLRELRQALEGMERLDLVGKHVQLEQERAQLVTVAFLAAVQSVTLLPADRNAMVHLFLKGIGRDPDRIVVGELE
jgi:hypothetical protein